MFKKVQDVLLSYTDEGQGAPLVFLHGYPFQRSLWEPQIQEFSRHCRVLAPDLRGFGESEASSGESSMDLLADDVHALLQELSVGPAVLVGHSMGGYVALAYALRHPDHLRGLVLVASRAEADSPEKVSQRRLTVMRLQREDPAFVADAMLPILLATSDEDPSRRARARALMRTLKPRGLVGALMGMASRPNRLPDLGKICVPTLVVAGAEDAMVPLEDSGIMAATFHNGRLEVVEAAGHLVSWEKPEVFNRVLMSWLETHDLL